MTKWKDKDGRDFAKWKPAPHHLLEEGVKRDYIYIYIHVSIIGNNGRYLKRKLWEL
jgi:hypothetical protein